MSGPHRLTTRDYMATSSARNTAAVYAQGSYLVYADDCSVVLPGWWEAVRRAAAAGEVVAGAYQKHWDMHVIGGELVRSRVGGIDSRWDLGDPDSRVPITGGQLFGSSFGLPRQLLMAVNGLDELCDPVGGEDYQLGMRLAWSGAPIWYDRAMVTIESEDLHRQSPSPTRIDKSTDLETYMATLRRFGVEQRTVHGNLDSSSLIVDLMYGLRPFRSLGNHYELVGLDEDNLDATRSGFPVRHWFDGQPLAEL
jgi:glycosyltransferase involved in cell wall biosynthesis